MGKRSKPAPAPVQTVVAPVAPVKTAAQIAQEEREAKEAERIRERNELNENIAEAARLKREGETRTAEREHSTRSKRRATKKQRKLGVADTLMNADAGSTLG